MNINKTTIALCCAAGLSGIAHANGLKPDITHPPTEYEIQKKMSFADWRAEKRRARYADTTDQVIVTMRSSDDAAALRIGLDAPKLLNSTDATAYKNALTKLKHANSLMTDFAKKAGLPLRYKRAMKSNKVVFKLPKAMLVSEAAAIASSLETSVYAARAEPDPKRWPLAENTPWGYSAVQSSQVSDAAAGNMTVCVIDSGYDIENPDVPSAARASGTNDSGTGNWSEAGGSHGTHVAGTIAAVGDNDQGIKGVIPSNINLHIIKVFSESGWTYSSSLTSAISDCQSAGAKVVNMSLGGPTSSTTEANALENFKNNGMLLVAAAGNDGDSSFSYPASYDSVISVAAVDENLQHANFSQYTSQVEVSGPGEAILSTVERGDGRQGYITYGSVTLGDDEVLPQTRYVPSGNEFVVSDVNDSASGDLAVCTRNNSTYSCGDMTDKICVVERNDNQSGSNYPENRPAEACVNAGAAGVIVYSNADRPGLQNPFLVDQNAAVNVPTLSVNRTIGQQLVAAAGTFANIEAKGSTDYAYYNGTSMASPHVAAVAALAWSANPSCTASEVRTALKQTALDIDVAGRDNRTGWGLVQAGSASEYMAENCGNNTGGANNSVLTNGTTVNNLSGAKGSEKVFTLEVPAGATDLSFNLADGSGDADLYVSFGGEPTTSSYDCRSWNSGNQETCTFDSPQAGTYVVKVHAYTAFSGASLSASFSEASSGGGSGITPESGSVQVPTTNRNNWARYTLEVPTGATKLVLQTSGGTGDADLYVRFGSSPTTTQYDCRPYKSGNNEVCQIDNPTAGNWHIGIRADQRFSGVMLNYAYE